MIEIGEKKSTIEIVKEDITKEDVDAIVNEASESLYHSSGLAERILMAAGAGM